MLSLIALLCVSIFNTRAFEEHDLVQEVQTLLFNAEDYAAVLVGDLRVDHEYRTPLQQMIIEAAYARSRGWLYGGAVVSKS